MSRDDFMGKAWLEVSDVAKGSGPGEEQEITLTLGDCPMENPGMFAQQQKLFHTLNVFTRGLMAKNNKLGIGIEQIFCSHIQIQMFTVNSTAKTKD